MGSGSSKSLEVKAAAVSKLAAGKSQEKYVKTAEPTSSSTVSAPSSPRKESEAYGSPAAGGANTMDALLGRTSDINATSAQNPKSEEFMPFWAVSLETFEAEHPDELPLERGDTVLILGDDGQGQGWLQAFKGDTYGFVPEVTDSLASASALPFIMLRGMRDRLSMHADVGYAQRIEASTSGFGPRPSSGLRCRAAACRGG